ncbi:MAG TPA: hypothetical protein PLI31_06855 [Methanoregulaceae archaeon]|nr:hypothetical protein [Methanoregulaceae archaeon]
MPTCGYAEGTASTVTPSPITTPPPIEPVTEPSGPVHRRKYPEM